jgi:hypothetical protein
MYHRQNPFELINKNNFLAEFSKPVIQVYVSVMGKCISIIADMISYWMDIHTKSMLVSLAYI